MKTQDEIRQFILERSEQGDDGSKGALAGWSKALGRNHAYLYQFIHKKTPKKLSEDDRSKLAGLMEVPESALKAGAGDQEIESDTGFEPGPMGGIKEIDVRAGLGGGGTVDQNLAWQHGSQVDPIKSESWKFPARFVREEIRAPEDRVRIIETQGDSMSPTILSGDRVIIDTGHNLPSPDGLYAIRDRYGSIVVKRLQVLRRGDPMVIRVISDNKSHDAEDVGADEIHIVGRVLWGLKRL